MLLLNHRLILWLWQRKKIFSLLKIIKNPNGRFIYKLKKFDLRAKLQNCS